MRARGLALQILFAIVFSFAIWAIIWFMLVKPNRPYIEMPHATGQFAGLAGFLYLAFYSSIFGVAISVLTVLFLPTVMAMYGWEGRLGWMVAGAILGEITVWIVAFLLYVAARTVQIPALRLDGALMNTFLWVPIAIPFGIGHALFVHNKTFHIQQPETPGLP